MSLKSYLFYLFIPALASAGCQALYTYRPAPVLAVDAETKRPIPGAELKIIYPTLHPTAAPWISCGRTGADGMAQLRAALAGQDIVMIEASAPGYLADEREIPEKILRALKPRGLFENPNKRPAVFVMAMYAEPRPALELVVPPAYRGMVKADIRIKEELPNPSGNRVFSFPVPQSGLVQVEGPSLLRRVFPQSCSFRFADGFPLSLHAQQSELGFWWIRNEAAVHFFFIGTKLEYESYCRSEKEVPGFQSRQPDGAATESRGRHGGRGNRTSSPATP